MRYRNSIAHKTLFRVSGARSPRRESSVPSPHRLSRFDGQCGSGHPDPDFRSTSLNTTSSHATAPPAAGTSLATDSTTADDRSADLHCEPTGTASRSPPHGTSRTPFATPIVSPPRAAPRAGATPAPSIHSTPSGSTPGSPSPYTPRCAASSFGRSPPEAGEVRKGVPPGQRLTRRRKPEGQQHASKAGDARRRVRQSPRETRAIQVKA